MDCPRPIKSILPRFYPTWSSRTRPSMRIQRSEGLGSRLGGKEGQGRRVEGSRGGRRPDEEEGRRDKGGWKEARWG